MTWRRALRALAKELLGLPADVLVGGTNRLLSVLKPIVTSVPVVMAPSEDPVGQGLVHSLARPGTNFTGLSNLNTELQGKQMELLRELLPPGTKLGVLYPAAVGDTAVHERVALTRAQGWEVAPLPLANIEELEATLRRAAAAKVGAIFASGPALVAQKARVNAAATAARLPLMFPARVSPADTDCIYYGANFNDIWQRAAEYVDRIFKGANPAELPVAQPTRFDLIINLKTAAAMGLVVPKRLLLRATEVIE